MNRRCLMVMLATCSFPPFLKAQEKDKAPFAKILRLETYRLDKPVSVTVNDMPAEARDIAILYVELGNPQQVLPAAMPARKIMLGGGEAVIISFGSNGELFAIMAPVTAPLSSETLWLDNRSTLDGAKDSPDVQKRFDLVAGAQPQSLVQLKGSVDPGLLEAKPGEVDQLNDLRDHVHAILKELEAQKK